MSLLQRLEQKRAKEAAASGRPSEFVLDANGQLVLDANDQPVRKPAWVVAAEQRRLPAQVAGAPGDPYGDR